MRLASALLVGSMWLACGWLAACTEGRVGPDVEKEPAFCESGLAHRYDPLGSDEIVAWPDDLLREEDAGSPTGYRVALGSDLSPWAATLPDVLGGLVEGAGRLSGFARNGGLVMRFTGDVGEVPADGAASLTDDGLQLYDLSQTPPVRVPYRVEVSDEGRQLVVRPLRPLSGGAAHALVVTASHETPSGGCVAPSPLQRTMLSGSAEVDELDARLAAMAPRYAALHDQLGLPVGEISGALVFTTHDEQRVLAGLVDHIGAETYTWNDDMVCIEQRVCAGSFDAWDYRHDRAVSGEPPLTKWTLPVTIWLPEGPGPHPTLVYGHGMSGSRWDGQAAFDRLADLGLAVVAIDNLEHGEHPTSSQDNLNPVRFLGIDLTGLRLDLLALRGNFNQSSLDRLQLIELIRQAPDVDGDGVDDLSVDTMGYLGISLGGMMGSSLMALSDDVQVGALPVAGGHLMAFAIEGEVVESFIDVLYQLLGSEEAFLRWLTVGQAMVDPADPATWAPHVQGERLVGSRRPDVLLPVSRFDRVVPPPAGRALARGLGVPHLGPVLDLVDGLDVVEQGPLRGNVDGVTGGYFQFDRVGPSENVKASNHDNLPWSEEGTHMLRSFYGSWLQDGRAEIVDPYEALGTPAL